MNERAGVSVIARKARGGAARRAAVTPERALGMALARAAEAAAGLRLTVLDISEDLCLLDALLATLEGGDLLIGISDQRGVLGLAALDGEMRAALVEMQTVGALSPRPAEPRAPTSTDAALAAPTLNGFLSGMASDPPEPLRGWTTGTAAGQRLDGVRAAGLTLPQARYRLVRMTADLGSGKRRGQIWIALPETARARETVMGGSAAGASDWSRQLAAAVLPAPAMLHAVLHRMHLPLNAIEALRAGDILPLQGVTVNSVRIETSDGAPLARGRLGTVSGLRAVRLEEPPAPELAGIAPGRAALALGDGGRAGDEALRDDENAGMIWADGADEGGDPAFAAALDEADALAEGDEPETAPKS